MCTGFMEEAKVSDKEAREFRGIRVGTCTILTSVCSPSSLISPVMLRTGMRTSSLIVTRNKCCSGLGVSFLNQ